MFDDVQKAWDADTEYWYRYTYGEYGPVVDEMEDEDDECF